MLYDHLEFLNELIYLIAIETAKEDEYGDGHGSDSEVETEINQVKIWSKKVVVHNGMRAIWAAISTIVSHLGEKNPSRVFLQDAYYEAPLGLPIIAQLHEANIMKVDTLSLANIVLCDLNPCITTQKSIKDYDAIPYENLQGKILILDSTSSTAQKVHGHLQQFTRSRVAALLLVDSGLKNQQIGADKNQYGTVRIFTRDKKLTEKLYQHIKKNEPPLLSPTSHRHRRIMKRLGAVPTTKVYTRPSENLGDRK
jgi:hypothetical protein